MFGYKAQEILGRHFSSLYTLPDAEAGKPAQELQMAAAHGRFEDTGWRVRRDCPAARRIAATFFMSDML